MAAVFLLFWSCYASIVSDAAAGTITADALTIDTFQNQVRNDFGYWHGADGDFPVKHSPGYISLYPSSPDHTYYTNLASSSCTNLQPYYKHLLHIVFSGTANFSISLTQLNNIIVGPRGSQARYPETWDSVEAARYDSCSTTVTATTTAASSSSCRRDIYVPLEHFHIDLSCIISISVHGFFTGESLTLHRIEAVPPSSIGSDSGKDRSISVPPKLASGRLVLHCTRPNSFAFGIDDGQPALAADIMRILEEEDVLVTFFAVGNGLRDPEANFSGVYKEMARRGHQIALHSLSHPRMEALQSLSEIDVEVRGSMAALNDILGLESRYFRPPFGTVGARMRQRLAALINDPVIVNWSVDVEDWRWAWSDTPERQMEAFVRDVERGGNLVVMHYLSPSTVRYFRAFIRLVKAAGLHIMRVDQCMEDPASPPLRRPTGHMV